MATRPQLLKVLEFHRKAEQAYRQYGQTAKAEQAKAIGDKLAKELGVK